MAQTAPLTVQPFRPIWSNENPADVAQGSPTSIISTATETSTNSQNGPTDRMQAQSQQRPETRGSTIRVVELASGGLLPSDECRREMEVERMRITGEIRGMSTLQMKRKMEAWALD